MDRPIDPATERPTVTALPWEDTHPAVGSRHRPAPERGGPAGPVARLRPAARVLPVALVLGWCADFLFYGQSLGVGVPLFVGLLLVALFFLARLEGARPAWRNLWILAPLLFFATMIAVRANAFLTVLNVLAVLLLLTLVATFALAGRLHHLGVVGYPLVAMQVAFEAVLRPAPPTGALVQEGIRHSGRLGAGGALGRAVPLLRGFVLAAPVLLLFTALLAAADSIFAEYVQDAIDFWSLDGAPDLSEPLGHLSLILGVAWVAAGGLLFALHRRATDSGAEGDAQQAQQAKDALVAIGAPPFRLGFVEGVTVLALVDALFGLFVWVQFAYLFSGHAAATMHFERYRDYARKGFFELVAVTVLSLGLILSLRWLTSQRTLRQAHAFNALCSLMIGLALVMLASALQRLMLWESVQYYISSPTRLYVRTFIIWLAMTYGWLLFTLWLRQDRFAVGGFVAALGFLVTVNLLNPDADTARANLARQDDLATRFVSVLSEDAVPALPAGLDTTTGDAQRDLRRHLSERLRELEPAPTDWRSFHLARWRAKETLLALRAAGKID